MKRVLISIINFNGEENTLSCLETLNHSYSKDITVTVLVVDNASENPLKLDAKKYKYFMLEVYYKKRNAGFSGGHNVAFQYALEKKFDYVVVLNNDTLVNKSCIENLIAACQRNPHAGLLSPKIYFAKGSEFHKNSYTDAERGRVIWYAGGKMDWKNVLGQHRGVDEVDNGQYNEFMQTDFASGCCMLIPLNVIKKTGKLDENFFLYYEDADYSERVKKNGFGIYFVPTATIFHKNAGSTGGSGSVVQDYFISRNRLLFGYRYAPFRTKVALLRESLQLLWKGRKWQKKGIRDYYLRIFGKGSFKAL